MFVFTLKNFGVLPLLLTSLFFLRSAAEEPTLVVQGGHTSQVGSVALNHAGTLLASNGSDGRILLWDVASGLTLRAIEIPQPGQIAGIGFTADDGIVLTIGSSGVFAFEVSSGRLEWHNPTYAVFATVSAGSNRIALYDGTVLKILDSLDGRVLRTIDSGIDVPAALALTSDGRGLAVGSGDKLFAIGGPDKTGVPYGGIAIYDTESGAQTKKLSSSCRWFSAVAFSSTGDDVAAVGFGGESNGCLTPCLQIWPLFSSQPRISRELPYYSSISQALSFISEDKSIAIGVTANQAPAGEKLLTYDSSGEFHLLKDPIGTIWHLSYAPRSGVLAGSGPGAAIALWDVRTSTLIETLPTITGGVDRLQTAGDRGERLFVEEKGQLDVVDLANARLTRVLPLRWTVVSPDGSRAAGDPSASIAHTQVIDTRSGTLILDTPEVKPGESIVRRALSRKGNILAEAVTESNTNQTRVKVWDVDKSSLLFVFDRAAYPRELAILQDDDAVVVEDKSGIELWSISQRGRLYELKQPSEVAYVRFGTPQNSVTRTIHLDSPGARQWEATTITVTGGNAKSELSPRFMSLVAPGIGSRNLIRSSDLLATDQIVDWRTGTSISLDYILLDSLGRPWLRVKDDPEHFKMIDPFTRAEYSGSWDALNLPGMDKHLFTPNGDTYIGITRSGELLAWSGADGHFLYALNASGKPIATWAFSDGGDRLFTGDNTGAVHIWDLGARKSLATFVSLGQEDWILVDDEQHFTGTHGAEAVEPSTSAGNIE